MRNSFFIVAPELATVGQTSRAYLQRWVVILLALTCSITSFVLIRTDCRVFKVTDADATESSLTNFSKAVDSFFEDIGLEVPDVESGSNRTDLFTEKWQEYETVRFGPYGYQPVDENLPESEQEQCIPFADVVGDFEMTPAEEDYILIMWTLNALTAPCGFIGILFAMVELCFCVFYPSVIAGAIFLAMAACTETAWLFMYVLDHRTCFAAQTCFVDVNFWVYIFVIGGFFFSSNLLIFGLRTYPWCCRKNRDPDHCKVVDAEVLSEEEIYIQQAKWDARRNKDPESYLYDDGSVQSETSYSTLKEQLQDAQRKLAQCDKDRAMAIARAERAEAMLKVFEQRKRESTVVKFEEPKIQKDAASVVTNEDDYVDAVAYTGQDE